MPWLFPYLKQPESKSSFVCRGITTKASIQESWLPLCTIKIPAYRHSRRTKLSSNHPRKPPKSPSTARASTSKIATHSEPTQSRRHTSQSFAQALSLARWTLSARHVPLISLLCAPSVAFRWGFCPETGFLQIQTNSGKLGQFGIHWMSHPALCSFIFAPTGCCTLQTTCARRGAWRCRV